METDNGTLFSRRLATMLMAILVGITASIGGSIISSAPAQAYSFNRSGAVSYANSWYYRYNSNYQNLNDLGGDCTNFLSQAWHEGGAIPFDQSGANQWYHTGHWYYSYGIWRWVWTATGSFTRVRDFRSYWYTFGSRYVYVEGSSSLSAAYSPALLGDAYIYDSGNSSSAPSWSHANIDVGWSTGHDMYAQHSPGKTNTDWRNWYWTRTSSQRYNMAKSGHGIRVISP
jgi:hypothetical protein